MAAETTRLIRHLVTSNVARIVLDTNFYLDLREHLGYNPDGRLQRTPSDVDCGDHGGVIAATHLGSFEVEFVVPVAVKNELFACLRNGYNQCPVGLGDAKLVASALRELIDLTPPDRTTMGAKLDKFALPDPPLPAREINDRCIYQQAHVSKAILITRDKRLLDAVQGLSHPVCPAFTPKQFIDAAIELERMTHAATQDPPPFL